jgi:hypothetical protein
MEWRTIEADGLTRYGVRALRNECHIVSSRGHPAAEIASDGTRCS